MAQVKRGGEAPIYQLKVTLRDSRPPIWRRLQVAGDTKLDKLHRILQIVMGWTDSHLHQFVADGAYYGTPDPELPEIKSERRVRLSDVAPKEKAKFAYEHDFGDNGEQENLVAKILP